ncbi:DUF1254 domain-containing protein [Erythrobacter tepidarius]|uniref:DUF1254 domain-containing protein n=1 Tax=Erythrobacter tepidarius TaxID=60454 RepID=UPI001FE6B364|nr:DUF1254 domain-containing protein [Erythrobacter tepidarius]
MPNNDTLYSSCWLDLAGGAHADVDVPVNAGRYVSAALMGMDSDVLAVESSTGRSAATGRLRIVGPDWRGTPPSDRRLLRLPGCDAWLLVRVGVDGAEDLAAAQAVQAQIGLNVVGAGQIPSPLLGTQNTTQGLRAVVNAVLSRTAANAPMLRRARHHRRFGIGTAIAPRPDAETAWSQAVTMLDAAHIGDITAHGRIANGWHWPDRTIARFGANERFRAAVALSGLGALPETEAIYLTAMKDATGAPLAPGRGYRIDFATPPPVDAFWSLSAYRGEPDGRYFFVANPLHRFAVGSTTPGLRNGGTVIVAPTQPASGGGVWLPIVDGPFRLVLRAYRPQATLLDRRWRPPVITPLD